MPDTAPQSDWPTLYAKHLAIWNGRLEAALEAADCDSAVILAGDERLRHRDDLPYAFAAEPYFKAWLPLTRHPGSALKLTPGERPKLLLLREEGFWHEPVKSPEGFWVEHFEIREVPDAETIGSELQLDAAKTAVIGEASATVAERSAKNEAAVLQALDYHRAYKTAYEIACVAEANAIAARGHVAAATAFEAGASEFELNAAYLGASTQTETDLPYPNIVALNEHAAMLHYQNLKRERPDAVHSFLIDAGAQHHGYASDITRTYSSSDDEFRSLIAAMDVMQQTICNEVVNGISFATLNDRAHELLAGVLAEQEIILCSAAEAYEGGMTTTFLPHGLGHLLGLQVHDVGGRLAGPDGSEHPPSEKHPKLRMTRPLESSMVATIEPGLYFIPSLLDKLRKSPLGRNVHWDKIATLQACGGIRVEDDIVVTDEGARNLSRPALRATT